MPSTARGCRCPAQPGTPSQPQGQAGDALSWGWGRSCRSLNGSLGSPLQPEAGMREAGEREDGDAETLCHGELPLPCPPASPEGLPWAHTLIRVLGLLSTSRPREPLPCPVLTLGWGAAGEEGVNHHF